MNELLTIVILLLAASVVAAVLFWRKTARLEGEMQGRARQIEEQQQETEKARRELKERREEVEQTKKLLLEAKTKLKKQQKESPQASPGGKKGAEAEAPPQPSATAIVRVTNEEVEAQHRRALEKLQASLDAALAELQKLKEERAVQQEDWNPVQVRSERPTPVEMPAAPPVSAEPAAAAHGPDLGALKAELETVKKSAAERERGLRGELKRAQENAASAARRATNNHQLYQVIKGQLELIEDRLATVRRRYEGAKTPEELRREQRKRGESGRRAPASGPSAAAGAAGGGGGVGNGAHASETKRPHAEATEPEGAPKPPEGGAGVPERGIDAPAPPSAENEAIAQADAAVGEELPSDKSLAESEPRGG